MEKAFEKQIKTIEDQGEKQMKAIQDQGQVKKNMIMMLKILHLSQKKEIFNELVDERLEKITDLDKKVNNDDLIYRYKGNTADVKFDNDLTLLNKIKDGKISLTDAKNNQKEFKEDLGEIKKGNT